MTTDPIADYLTRLRNAIMANKKVVEVPCAEAYGEAERTLNEHWDAVVAVAEALLKHETLSADEVRRLMRGEPLGKPSVSDLLAAESRRLAQEQAAIEKPKKPESKPADDDFGSAIPAPA